MRLKDAGGTLADSDQSGVTGFDQLVRLSFSRILALLLALSVFEHALILRMAIGPLLGIQSSAVLLVLVWLWLILMAGSIAGLLFERRWGVYFLVLLVPVSTFLHSIPLVPFVTQLAPAAYRPYAMMIVNALLLLTALVLMRRLPAQPRVVESNEIA